MIHLRHCWFIIELRWCSILQRRLFCSPVAIIFQKLLIFILQSLEINASSQSWAIYLGKGCWCSLIWVPQFGAIPNIILLLTSPLRRKLLNIDVMYEILVSLKLLLIFINIISWPYWIMKTTWVSWIFSLKGWKL